MGVAQTAEGKHNWGFRFCETPSLGDPTEDRDDACLRKTLTGD